MDITTLYCKHPAVVRLASPEARCEAITSRPWLMSSIGRRTEHAGQATITLTGLHAHFDRARQVLMQVSARIQAWAKEITEQLLDSTVWLCVCEHLKQTIAAVGPPKYPPLLAISRLLKNGHRPHGGHFYVPEARYRPKFAFQPVIPQSSQLKDLAGYAQAL